MPKPKATSQPVASIRGQPANFYIRELGINPSNLRIRLQQIHYIEIDGVRHYELIPVIKACWDLIPPGTFFTPPPDADAEIDWATVDPETLPPSLRKDWYAARRTKIEVEKTLGQWVDENQYRRDLAGVAKTVVTFLDVLPPTLEHRCALAPAVVEQIEKEINSMRVQLAEKVRSLAVGEGTENE